MLKITEYADKLLDGLDKLDWPEKVKLMQRNWIGKSQGAQITFNIKDHDDTFAIYTTCPETLFGVTFVAMAADHDLVEKITTPEQAEAVKAYRHKVVSKKNKEHVDQTSGVFTGAYAINPINNQEVPIYLTDYVLKDYGTGVVMAVPAHDDRDFEFAQAFDIPIKEVIQNPQGEMDGAYTGDGVLINSGLFDGMQAKTEGTKKIVDYLVRQGAAERKTNYRLRDWVFSRQRYWGEPLPLVHCDACGIVPVPEDQLPVELPQVERYEPTDTGESPLALIDEWVNTTCPSCDGPAKRETNTMPNWAGSSWYFLRYPNPDLKDAAFDQKDMRYWLPVDLYVGGVEHAILHLLYARFYVKVLYDQGHVSFDEPFKRLFNQGMITRLSDKSGHVEKMSKSKGNVVNPDDIVQKYGSDVMRMYILFMGPPELDCEWQDSGLEGVKRFENRFWTFMANPKNILSEDQDEDLATKKRVHRLLAEFAGRIEHFKPNTALAAFMEFLNEAMAQKFKLSRESAEAIIITLSVMAPHMASELLEKLFDKKWQDCNWQVYDSALAARETASVAIQINGKTRGIISVSVSEDQESVEERARKEVAKWLVEKNVVKTIYVPTRLVNFVIQ
jgi:leucyl-tRNA synthetase